MRKRRGTAKPPPDPEAVVELLERLKAVAQQAGVEVREERLLREVGYSVRSGLCRINDKDVVLLDKNVAASERVDVLTTVLSTLDLDALYIEPELRERIFGPGSGDNGQAESA